jgi:hypothetical protein
VHQQLIGFVVACALAAMIGKLKPDGAAEVVVQGLAAFGGLGAPGWLVIRSIAALAGPCNASRTAPSGVCDRLAWRPPLSSQRVRVSSPSVCWSNSPASP